MQLTTKQSESKEQVPGGPNLEGVNSNKLPQSWRYLLPEKSLARCSPAYYQAAPAGEGPQPFRG